MDFPTAGIPFARGKKDINASNAEVENAIRSFFFPWNGTIVMC